MRIQPPISIHSATRIVWVAAFIFFAAISSAQADSGSAHGVALPSLGEAGSQDLSPGSELRLGRAIFQELMRAGVVHDDPEAQDYLQVQAGRLLQAAGRQGHLSDGPGYQASDFRFFLVKDPSINAFALPGGFVGVHTGLIVQSTQESELMSVLAHEIGHVTQRHIARMFGQQKQSSAVLIAAALLASIAAGSSPDAAVGLMSLGQTVAVRDQLAFSRDAEREADRVGLGLLQEAGFEPQAMASLFQKLSQAGRYYDSALPSWVRSHPLTSERIADIQARLQALGAEQGGGHRHPESLEFRWIRQRLESSAQSSVDGLRAMATRLEDRRAQLEFSDPPAQAQIAFGQAWVALAQREPLRARVFLEQSLVAARAASIDSEVFPFLAVAWSKAWLMEQQPARALEMIEKALSARPQSVSTRLLVRQSIEAQLALDQTDAPLERARWWVAHWPHDSEGWRIYAQVADRARRKTEAHAASAERYWLLGALPAALEQFRLARAAADSDFMSLSEIDAKVEQLRLQITRESRSSLEGQAR